MPANEKDLTQTKFAVTNFVESYNFDANATSVLIVNDVVATLIRDLAEKGIINPSGTFAA